MPTDGLSYWPDMLPPVFLTPTDPANVLALTGFTIILTALIVAIFAQPISTSFEIWTGPEGSGTMLWSVVNSTNLLLQIVPALAISAGTRYLRARFNGSGYQSAWSEDKVLTVI